MRMGLLFLSGAACLLCGHGAWAEDIDTVILKRLNDGRLGTHPHGNGVSHRVADRIVSLNVNVVTVDSVRDVPFADAGKRTGEQKFYSYTNCGTAAQKLHFHDTFEHEVSQEIEFTKEVKTSVAFSGKMTTDMSFFWGKVGTEGNASVSKDITMTDRNKRTSSSKTTKEEDFDFEAQPKTRVIYQATTGGGISKKEFSGTVLVTGVFHYVIGNIWDQDAVIEKSLSDEKDRTFPFTGTLSTINLSTLDVQRTEQPLSAAFCKERAQLAQEQGTQLLVLAPTEGKKAFGEAKKAANTKR